MGHMALIRTLVREILIRGRSPRRPEPAAVMEDDANVAAYAAAGRTTQAMMQSYLFNAAHICDVLRPGDLVLDLACGPATLLTIAARLNPAVRFVGIDLSAEMLEAARAEVERAGATNIELRHGDMTRLDGVGTQSVNAVISSFALHHLPSRAALALTFQEIARVLKPDGGLFIFDFGHLRSERSIDYFATRHAHLQSDCFTEDYRNSLRAAFYSEDVRQLADEAFGGRARFFVQRPLGLMFAVKGPVRQSEPQRLRAELAALRDGLPVAITEDLKAIVRLFKLDGLDTPLLR